MTIADESLELLESVVPTNPLREIAIREAVRQVALRLPVEAAIPRPSYRGLTLESLARLSVAVSYGALNGAEVDHDAVEVDALEALMLAGVPAEYLEQE